MDHTTLLFLSYAHLSRPSLTVAPLQVILDIFASPLGSVQLGPPLRVASPITAVSSSILLQC